MILTTKRQDIKGEAMYLIQTISVVNQGFRVGGVTMHLEKAMGVGTVILTVIVAVVKLHSLPGTDSSSTR